MNIEGAQFSKSRNWAIWLPDILERYDPDAIRYYIAAAMPEARDSEFSWAEFVRRNNDELVAAWGNLANRVLSFAYRHFDGQVPEPGALGAADRELLDQIGAGFQSVGDLLEGVKIRAALNEALGLARAVNGYLDRAPWYSVIKDDRQAAARTVFTALSAIDSLKIMLAPFLPFSSEKLHRLLGYDQSLFGEQKIEIFQESERSHAALTYDPSLSTGAWKGSELKPGQRLREPEPLYIKLDDTVIEKERAHLGADR